jgi:hypothetical protein
MSNIVLARVKAKGGFFDSIGALHPAGSMVYVDLDALGIKDLSKSQVLEAAPASGDAIAEARVSSVAPRAPGATMPQGLPSGARQTGANTFVMPAGPGDNAEAISLLPDTLVSELEPEAPIRRDSDIDPVGHGGGNGEEASEADRLVRENSKDELLAMARNAGVAGVSADNNKAEIAAKIVAAR